MVSHLLAVHEEEEEDWGKIEFRMRIIKSMRTAFERQTLESVTIQKKRNHEVQGRVQQMPRLTANLGEKEKWRAADREEMERKATIEQKIRIRKKENGRNKQKYGARTAKEKEAKIRRWTSKNIGGVKEKEEKSTDKPSDNNTK
jgi:hypothetical protein